jgi:hypothetical protein
MPRLLTDEQVRHIAKESAFDVVDWCADALHRDFKADAYRSLREAIEHDLIECLEGLMEPDEGEGS